MSEKHRTSKKKFESYTEKALSDREYRLLLQTCNTYEQEALLRIAVEMGLRRADISKLKIQNVDLDNGRLTFHEYKKDRDRTLPMTDELTGFLKKYIGTLPKNQKYLFPWGESKYGDYTAWRRLQDLCDRSGLPRRAFHALRGTCYKFKKSSGWSVEQAAYFLGDTVQVAMEHYGQPSDGEIDDLVRGIK